MPRISWLYNVTDECFMSKRWSMPIRLGIKSLISDKQSGMAPPVSWCRSCSGHVRRSLFSFKTCRVLTDRTPLQVSVSCRNDNQFRSGPKNPIPDKIYQMGSHSWKLQWRYDKLYERRQYETSCHGAAKGACRFALWTPHVERFDLGPLNRGGGVGTLTSPPL